jgi:hypothetical protein
MNEAVVILQASITVMLLWAFWYLGWKQYQLDKLRQELFCLRDDLFLLVAKSEIPLDFKDRIYVEWRRYFNITIRFCHLSAFNRLFWATLLSKLPVWGATIDLKNFKTTAEKILEDEGSEVVKKQLLGFRERVSQAFAWYFFTTSPIFAAIVIVTIPCIIVICLCRTGIRNISQALRKCLNETWQEPMRTIEAEAEVSWPQAQVA